MLAVKDECEDALAACGGLRSLTAPRAVIGTSVGNLADASGDSAMFPINQVLQGDCTRVLKRLPDNCVDLIVTDPPYGVRYHDSFGRRIANDDDPSRVLGAFIDLYRMLGTAAGAFLMARETWAWSIHGRARVAPANRCPKITSS